ncbi:MAG: KH domain-containing protein [Chthonomonas sp.]|nr:KH domain-containing protein [Chthonomonas sp.]
MQSIELTVKSVEEAKKTAAEKLGVSADQIVVTVLEETKGLFGKASLKVRAEAGSDEPKAEKKPRGRAPKAEKAAEPAAEVEVEAPAPKAKPAPRAAKPAAKAAKPAKAEKPQAVESDADGDDTEVEVVATEADGEALCDLINQILELSGLEASVQPLSLNGRYVNIEIDGKDVAYLVGKHGEVLNNLQYLVNVIAGKQLGNGVRATLDGNNYRARREEALANLAATIAEQVLERKEEAVLDALPAFERRLVHRALVEMEGITTYSEGEEPNRRVVIAPAE